MIIDAPGNRSPDGLRFLWKQAFGDEDAFLDAFFSTAFSPQRSRCVLMDGEPAAALYWFDCRYETYSAAYIYAVATAEAYRGRGLCTALMEDTHRHLRRSGYDAAVLVPGSASLFDFYRRFGYREFGGIRELPCAAGDGAVPVRAVDAEEYAFLRRRYLPRRGVVQEGENLSFLKTQASLYAGENFLLAARQEGEHLFGAELLGETGAASSIVRALGCRSGQFRIPGDSPFAMLCSLCEKEIPAPAYFGLAFD